MATTRNIQMQYYNGTDYDTLYPAVQIGNVDGLQSSLDSKLNISGGTMTGDLYLGDSSNKFITSSSISQYTGDINFKKIGEYPITISLNSNTTSNTIVILNNLGEYKIFCYHFHINNAKLNGNGTIDVSIHFGSALIMSMDATLLVSNVDLYGTMMRLISVGDGNNSEWDIEESLYTGDTSKIVYNETLELTSSMTTKYSSDSFSLNGNLKLYGLA